MATNTPDAASHRAAARHQRVRPLRAARAAATAGAAMKRKAGGAQNGNGAARAPTPRPARRVAAGRGRRRGRCRKRRGRALLVAAHRGRQRPEARVQGNRSDVLRRRRAARNDRAGGANEQARGDVDGIRKTDAVAELCVAPMRHKLLRAVSDEGRAQNHRAFRKACIQTHVVSAEFQLDRVHGTQSEANTLLASRRRAPRPARRPGSTWPLQVELSGARPGASEARPRGRRAELLRRATRSHDGRRRRVRGRLPGTATTTTTGRLRALLNERQESEGESESDAEAPCDSDGGGGSDDSETDESGDESGSFVRRPRTDGPRTTRRGKTRARARAKTRHEDALQAAALVREAAELAAMASVDGLDSICPPEISRRPGATEAEEQPDIVPGRRSPPI